MRTISDVELFRADGTSVNLKLTSIGAVDTYNGQDEYVLVQCFDDEINEDEVKHRLEDVFYRSTEAVGGYFCNTVHCVQKPHSDNQVIAIIFHRYDI